MLVKGSQDVTETTEATQCRNESGYCARGVEGKQSVAEAARKHRVQESLIYKWRSEVIEKLPMVFSENAASTEAEQQIEDLKRLIGQQTIEIEALKKAGRWLSRLSRPGGASSAT